MLGGLLQEIDYIVFYLGEQFIHDIVLLFDGLSGGDVLGDEGVYGASHHLAGGHGHSRNVTHHMVDVLSTDAQDKFRDIGGVVTDSF